MRVRPVKPVFMAAGGVAGGDYLRGVLFMSDLRKAAQMALEALEGFVYHGIGPNSGPALASLRAALAQPEPEQEFTVTFDAFVKQIREKAIYETIYADTEGRDILVITLLDAYVLMRHTAPPQRKPLRTVIYACPICAASLERQE
jgi:hypothetical protein